MRNRYFVAMATALAAVLLIAATGCKGNPETAKKKYLESGQSYVEKKQYDAAVIQFKKAIQVDPKYAEQLMSESMPDEELPAGVPRKMLVDADA